MQTTGRNPGFSGGTQITLRQLCSIRATLTTLVYNGSIPTTRQADLAVRNGMDQQAFTGANQEIAARRLRVGTIALPLISFS